MLTRMKNDWNFHMLQNENTQSGSTLSNSYKVKQTLILGICPREMKTYVSHKNLFKNVYSSIFVITTNWKQPKCLLLV